MAAGDLLEGPGDVEWAGILISAHHTTTGYWTKRTTRRNGWSPTWTADDLATEAGASPGRPVPDPMYPDLIGAAVNTGSQVADLWDLMDPEGDTAGPLCWWDYALDLKLKAPTAHPRRRETGDAGDQMWSHRLVDLQWMIPRSGLIVVLS